MKKQICILFTSVGRRVELVQQFRKAAANMRTRIKIIGADLTLDAPALAFCDSRRQVCRIRDDNYIPQLLSICKEEHVDLLIPTIDTDLLLLSQIKEEFLAAGTRVLISAEDKIKICRDKRYTSQFFVDCGLAAPLPVDQVKEYNSGFPCFIKPKDGSSSIDAYKVDKQDDLEMYANKVKDYIIQPFIDGIEYTIDIFCDFDGNPVYITPRERVAVRSGEVLKTQIKQDETMILEALQLIQQFKPCGPITVQLIQDSKTHKNYYIEINPRFGGGAPLSMKAGADAAAAIIQLLSGEKLSLQKGAAKDNSVYSRFDQSVCTSSQEIIRIQNLSQILEQNWLDQVDAVIFDLDDTLYQEKDYIRSGFARVGEILCNVSNAKDKLWKYFEEGKQAIDELLINEGCFSDELKQKCLHAYQFQEPDIKLSDATVSILKNLRQRGKMTGIITDGRVEGQRAKIHSLGLNLLVDQIIITDELGGIQFRKPNDLSFRIMQNRMLVDFSKMVYVGDNLTKDFQAPAMLGMQCVLLENQDGLYYRV